MGAGSQKSWRRTNPMAGAKAETACCVRLAGARQCQVCKHVQQPSLSLSTVMLMDGKTNSNIFQALAFLLLQPLAHLKGARAQKCDLHKDL